MAAVRPLRADAERNRRRILDAARTVFAEHGIDAGVDAVARAAGVGMGTLYRRFPTKDDLLAALVTDRVDELVAKLAAAGEHEDPWTAVEQVMTAFVELQVRDRGFYEALHQRAAGLACLVDAKEQLYASYAPVLERAKAAGVLREDLAVEDVPMLCALASRISPLRLSLEPELWRRYLGVLLDGLRPAGASALAHPPPRALTPEDLAQLRAADASAVRSRS